MTQTLLIKNARLFRDSELFPANVLIQGGKIKKILSPTQAARADEEFDAEHKILLPGAIDVHVHFRDSGAPGGFEYKEDFESGGAAAAAGGVTTVVDMPNCVPPTTTAGALKKKLAAARAKSAVNYFANFGVEKTKDGINEGEIKRAARESGFVALKLFMGSSTGGLLVEDNALMEKAFEIARGLGKKACIHAEDETLVKKFSELARRKGVEDWNKARPPICALWALKAAVALAARAECGLHVCHATTEGEVSLIAKAKKHGMKISCEVTPHHLFLDEGDARSLKAFGKTNPPLRSKKDQAALWRALSDGVIDCVASDHAPHTRGEKERVFWDAPSGVPGVETMLPLLLNAVNEGRLSLKQVVELTSENPARLFGFKKKGRVAEGADADLTLVDLEKKKKVRGEELQSKSGWTPFEGFELKGWPVATIVGGKIVFSVQ